MSQPNIAEVYVTREGRTLLALSEGEALTCGFCQGMILGAVSDEDQTCLAWITTDSLDSQDFVVLCQSCLDELAGPEFES